MNYLDHVLVGVSDLEAAGQTLRRDHGWGTLPGGSPAPGLHNAVIPLEPPTYLELITPTDRSASDPAAKLAKRIADGDRLFTWALEPDDLDAVAARLGLVPWGGGAGPARWRIVGEVEPARPFFIEYDVPRKERTEGWRASYARAGHVSAPRSFTFLEIGGDEEQLRAWVGEVDVPLRFAGTTPGLRAVGISTERGEVIVR